MRKQPTETARFRSLSHVLFLSAWVFFAVVAATGRVGLELRRARLRSRVVHRIHLGRVGRA